jgi:hypothetical protein
MSHHPTSTDMTLFHVLNDAECAEVRKAIVQLNLIERVQFRNIDRSEGAASDLLDLQGSAEIPYLVFEHHRYKGKAEILSFLSTLTS